MSACAITRLSVLLSIASGLVLGLLGHQLIPNSTAQETTTPKAVVFSGTAEKLTKVKEKYQKANETKITPLSKKEKLRLINTPGAGEKTRREAKDVKLVTSLTARSPYNNDSLFISFTLANDVDPQVNVVHFDDPDTIGRQRVSFYLTSIKEERRYLVLLRVYNWEKNQEFVVYDGFGFQVKYAFPESAWHQIPVIIDAKKGQNYYLHVKTTTKAYWSFKSYDLYTVGD